MSNFSQRKWSNQVKESLFLNQLNTIFLILFDNLKKKTKNKANDLEYIEERPELKQTTPIKKHIPLKLKSSSNLIAQTSHNENASHQQQQQQQLNSLSSSTQTQTKTNVNSNLNSMHTLGWLNFLKLI